MARLRHGKAYTRAVGERKLPKPSIRIKHATLDRLPRNLHDNAPKGKHVGVVPAAPVGRRLVGEEGLQPIVVACRHRRADVGVALLVRPGISATMVPEVATADGQVDRVAAAPHQNASSPVRERDPLVAGCGAGELPLHDGCQQKRTNHESGLHMHMSETRRRITQTTVRINAKRSIGI